MIGLAKLCFGFLRPLVRSDHYISGIYLLSLAKDRADSCVQNDCMGFRAGVSSKKVMIITDDS